MNLDRIDGNLKHLGGQVKEQWSRLTGDDTGRAGGYGSQLTGLLQKAYGATKDEADRQASGWRSTRLERAASRAAAKAARAGEDAGDWVRDAASSAGSRAERLADKAARSADRMARDSGRGTFKTLLLWTSVGLLAGLYFYGDRDTDRQP